MPDRNLIQACEDAGLLQVEEVAQAIRALNT